MLSSPVLASLSGVVRTLLWLLIGWFVYRTVSRLFRSSSTLRRGAEDAPISKGEIHIDKNTPPSSGKVDESAEFVDFEELDDPNTHS